MMKKIFILLLAVCVLAISLIGCSSSRPLFVNIESKEGLSDKVFGINSLTELGDGLWYDKSTRIVYWWNGNFTRMNCDTTPTPYYAPNGMPYRYNPTTNTFEEIK